MCLILEQSESFPLAARQPGLAEQSWRLPCMSSITPLLKELVSSAPCAESDYGAFLLALRALALIFLGSPCAESTLNFVGR